MPKPTTLATGPITTTDKLVVELVGPPDSPARNLDPLAGFGGAVCQPTRFPAAALAIIALCDEALLAFLALDL